ncbi:hypothetical protein JHK87_003063 [Glycine soja]|nr:hypothetical protein JHK87_003063 [Glycine soja]
MMESCVPPGFRFHPTDEELVGYYLRKKVASQKIDLDVIKEIDLYRIEPWDLQEMVVNDLGLAEICRIGYEEQNEWYFFSHKDKKYPTGTRTNRATMAGFWKATGRDKSVYESIKLIGMRKTLVFYKGRAPNGQKTDWIMHEYRLETVENGPPQLPQLESPSLPLAKKQSSVMSLISENIINNEDIDNISQKGLSHNTAKKVTTDWRALDKFVASQLSQEERHEFIGVSSFATHHTTTSSDMALLLLQNNSRENERNYKFNPFLNTSSTSDCDIGICVFEK